jgi:RNA 2',3'-cyclic 3'-phosphodiesterase
VRLFVAVRPPSAAVRELSAVLDDARLAVPGLRWVAPPNWHLTIAFLGDVEPAQQPDVEVRLARAALRHEPMAMRLAGGGQFGGRVLYAGLQGDRAGLVRLARSVQAGARRAGVSVDERAYRPHLTVARSSRPVDLAPAVAALSSWSGLAWSASEVLLMSSGPPEGSGHPPTYAELGRWALGREAL